MASGFCVCHFSNMNSQGLQFEGRFFFFFEVIVYCNWLYSSLIANIRKIHIFEPASQPGAIPRDVIAYSEIYFVNWSYKGLPEVIRRCTNSRLFGNNFG